MIKGTITRLANEHLATTAKQSAIPDIQIYSLLDTIKDANTVEELVTIYGQDVFDSALKQNLIEYPEDGITEWVELTKEADKWMKSYIKERDAKSLQWCKDVKSAVDALKALIQDGRKLCAEQEHEDVTFEDIVGNIDASVNVVSSQIEATLLQQKNKTSTTHKKAKSELDEVKELIKIFEIFQKKASHVIYYRHRNTLLTDKQRIRLDKADDILKELSYPLTKALIYYKSALHSD